LLGVDENYYTNALTLLVKIIVCSKLHCQTLLNYSQSSIRNHSPEGNDPRGGDGRAGVIVVWANMSGRDRGLDCLIRPGVIVVGT